MYLKLVSKANHVLAQKLLLHRYFNARAFYSEKYLLFYRAEL